jgi:DnaJ-class molecular chaperone
LATKAHCELLGVAEGYSAAELKVAYPQKVQQWHPDLIQYMAPKLGGMQTSS